MGILRRCAAPAVAWFAAAGLVYGLFLAAFPGAPVPRDPAPRSSSAADKTPAARELDLFRTTIKQLRRDLKGKPRTAPAPATAPAKTEATPSTPPAAAASHTTRLFDPPIEFRDRDGVPDQDEGVIARAHPVPRAGPAPAPKPSALRLDPFFLSTPATPGELATIDYNALILEHADFSEPPTLVQSLANEFFAFPDLVLDPLIALLRAPSTGTFAASEPRSGGLSRNIFEVDIDFTERSRSLDSFMGNLIRQEMKFFSKFQGSYLNTIEYEEGFDDLSRGALGHEQGRVVFQALKRTFLSRYRISHMSDRLRDDGFNFEQWRSWDFIVLPPALAGYTYLYGFEKKLSVSDVRFRFRMDSLHRFGRFDEDHRDLHSGAALLIETPWQPINVIVSCGLYDSKLEMDFVGIGTDFEIVRKCLMMQN